MDTRNQDHKDQPIENRNKSLANLQERKLEKILELDKPVKAQHNVDFNQIFNIQLTDSFYEAYRSIYNFVSQRNSTHQMSYENVSHEEYINDNVLTLDYRPKRWFSQLKKLAKAIYEEKTIIQRLEIGVHKLGKKIEDTDILSIYLPEEKGSDDYIKYSNTLEKMKRDLASAEQHLAWLINQRTLIVNEIQLSNYEVKIISNDDKSKNSIQQESFELKKIITVFQKPILYLSSGMPIDQDNKWQEIVSNLAEGLKSAGLTKEQLAQFEEDRKLLSTNKAALGLEEKKDDAFLKIQAKQAEKAKNNGDNNSSLKRELAVIDIKKQEMDLKKQQALDKFYKSRLKFLEYWNNPKLVKPTEVKKIDIDENYDPVAGFQQRLKKLKQEQKKPLEQHVFSFKTGGFYDQSGLSLKNFMKLPDLDNKIIFLPYLDKSGRPSSEIEQVVINPRRPGRWYEPKLPSAKFVETNQLQVGWDRYVTAALCTSFNLFPGEKKEFTIERQTKLSRTVNQSMRRGEESQKRLTSSFEDNLHNEFSAASNTNQTNEASQTSSRSEADTTRSSTQASNEQSSTSSKTDTFKWDVSASASYMGCSLSASAGGSNSSSSSLSSGSKSAQSHGKESAFSIASQEQGHSISKNSRDTALKNVQNTVSKVASDTSNSNKLELSTTETQQSDESSSNKEVIRVENSNHGCCINYNFFQIQNVYKSKIQSKDVKIVIDTGIDLVSGVDIHDLQVLDLEEFNKMYLPNANQTDFEVLLFALIARNVLKHYTRFLEAEDINDGILKLNTPNLSETNERNKIKDIYRGLQVLSIFSKNNTNSQDESKNQNIESARAQLDLLRHYDFIFNQRNLIGESEYVVNAPASHVDAQLGLCSAIEPYFEERRLTELETLRQSLEKSKAETALIQAQADVLKRNPQLLQLNSNANNQQFGNPFTFFAMRPEQLQKLSSDSLQPVREDKNSMTQ